MGILCKYMRVLVFANNCVPLLSNTVCPHTDCMAIPIGPNNPIVSRIEPNPKKSKVDDSVIAKDLFKTMGHGGIKKLCQHPSLF